MNYILYFFFFSFAGWILETVYASVRFRKYISKQTLLRLPLCPIYGIGAVAMIITLYPVRNSVLLTFCGGFFVASCVEYLVALFYERYFRVSWWDYHGNIGNFDGKVCVKMSIIWGVIAIVFFRSILPLVDVVLNKMSSYLKLITSVWLLIVFFADYKSTLQEIRKYADNKKSLAEGKFWALKIIKINNM